MAIIEQTLQTLLLTIGKNSYLMEKNEGDNNCIVFKRIGTTPERTHNKTKGIDRYRFQVDCYGLSFSDSRSLADSVIGVLDMNNVNFKACLLNNDVSMKELDTGLYRTMLEFFVWG